MNAEDNAMVCVPESEAADLFTAHEVPDRHLKEGILHSHLAQHVDDVDRFNRTQKQNVEQLKANTGEGNWEPLMGTTLLITFMEAPTGMARWVGESSHVPCAPFSSRKVVLPLPMNQEGWVPRTWE